MNILNFVLGDFLVFNVYHRGKKQKMLKAIHCFGNISPGSGIPFKIVIISVKPCV